MFGWAEKALQPVHCGLHHARHMKKHMCSRSEQIPSVAPATRTPTDEGTLWEPRRPCGAAVDSDPPASRPHVLLPWNHCTISQKQKQSPRREASQETDLGFRPGLQPCLCPMPNLGPVLKLRDPSPNNRITTRMAWSWMVIPCEAEVGRLLWGPPGPCSHRASRSSRPVAALPHPVPLQLGRTLCPQQPLPGQLCRS